MAQSGFTPIQLYFSTTASATPSAGNLANGELAINITDGRLFYKDNGGTVRVLAGTGGSGVVAGSNTQVQFNNNGVFGASANMTFNGTRLTVADLADSGLTAGRVTYASTGGALVDSANLTFDGTRLGIGTATPAGPLHIAAANSAGTQFLTLQTTDTTQGNATIRWRGSAGTNQAFIGSYVGTADTGNLEFGNGTATNMQLSSGGNLGLGVTPSAWLASSRVVQVGNGGAIEGRSNSAQVMRVSANTFLDSAGTARYIGTGNAMVYEQFAGAHTWSTAASGTAGNAISFTQAMTLDASGNLGIGTSSPRAKLEIFSSLDSTFNSNAIIGGSATTKIAFDPFGGLSSGVGGLADGSLAFYGNGANTERARIDSSGNLLVGTTSSISRIGAESSANGRIVTGFSTASSGYSDAVFVAEFRNYSPNNTTARFLYCGDTTTDRLQIRSNGGIVNYAGNNVNISDRREKTNFAPAKSYLDTICAIPVQTFNYVDQNMEEDPGSTLGVVAQDVQAVAPELVMESNWGTEDNPKMRLSIYQTDLQYALMKCIQEQQAIITALTARVAALESNP